MQSNDAIRIVGQLDIVLRDQRGRIKARRRVKNLVTTIGKGVIANRMLAGPTLGAMTHMAVGTGGTAPATGDTQLQAEVVGSRTALTSATNNNNVTTYVCTFPAGVGSGALQEAGLFNAVSVGQMQNRSTYAAITKDPTDSLSITWTVTIT
jgi:Phage tail-collar fibre protein